MTTRTIRFALAAVSTFSTTNIARGSTRYALFSADDHITAITAFAGGLGAVAIPPHLRYHQRAVSSQERCDFVPH